jgi:NAD(P)H dehydrogenase (quinone)
MTVARKILIINGHPFEGSLTSALLEKYKEGAQAASYEVRTISVGSIDFDAVLHKGYREIQELEPDLKNAQESIMWADHIVLGYPVWWNTMPALLKGFFDRTFLPGFALDGYE